MSLNSPNGWRTSGVSSAAPRRQALDELTIADVRPASSNKLLVLEPPASRPTSAKPVSPRPSTGWHPSRSDRWTKSVAKAHSEVPPQQFGASNSANDLAGVSTDQFEVSSTGQMDASLDRELPAVTVPPVLLRPGVLPPPPLNAAPILLAPVPATAPSPAPFQMQIVPQAVYRTDRAPAGYSIQQTAQESVQREVARLHAQPRPASTVSEVASRAAQPPFVPGQIIIQPQPISPPLPSASLPQINPGPRSIETGHCASCAAKSAQHTGSLFGGPRRP